MTKDDLKDVIDAIRLSSGNDYVTVSLLEWVGSEMPAARLGGLMYHDNLGLSKDEIVTEAFRRQEAAPQRSRPILQVDGDTDDHGTALSRVHPQEDMDRIDMRPIVDVLLAFPNEGLRRHVIEIVHEKRPDINFDDLFGRQPPLTAEQIVDEIFGGPA